MQTKVDEAYELLRPYQKDGIEFFSQRDKNLNFDDMGLGKTVTTLISLVQKLIDDGVEEPRVLILCPKNALHVWTTEIEKWLDEETLIYTGTKPQRKKLWEQFADSNINFLVTSYYMTKELGDKSWDAMICDEIHGVGLLNHKTQTHQRVSNMAKVIKYIYLLTGTPIRQGCIDLYAPLNIVDPDRFTSYWRFVDSYCIKNDTPFGIEIDRRPASLGTFRALTGEYSIRRLKTDVAKDLPGKQRQPLTLTMTPKQKRVFRALDEHNMYIKDDVEIVCSNAMTTMLRLRQLLVTPRLLGIDDDGAALEQLKAEGEDLATSGKPFVIYTPFRQAIPHIENVISSWAIDVDTYVLQGGMTSAAFANAWQGFQEGKGPRVLICVIKSGASFHATCADICFFIGYEWDFNANNQAEDRLCRIGQKNFVNCYYMVYGDSYLDKHLLGALNAKEDVADWILSSDEVYQARLDALEYKG